MSNDPSPRRRAKARPYASATRTLAKEETRDALIAAALALFAEKGLDAPTIDEICSRAGFSRGAFYDHFGTRDALMVEAMKSRRRATFDGILEALGDSLSVPGLLELLGKLVAAGSFPPKAGVRSPEFLQACRRSQELRTAQFDLLDETRTQLAGVVRRDQQSGGVRPDVDPEALGALLILLEAGVELMADLGWRYDVRNVSNLVAQLVAAERKPIPPSAPLRKRPRRGGS
ncbi:TetR/AcrR family transcriptional regulator [Pendulispora rubella]|uniref:TetR/AcrR family transcriptional regulator n=1 Tax=Pendulispora rubella TaxID=2741070 RepID=A0ABZ2L7I1_9BACT